MQGGKVLWAKENFSCLATKLERLGQGQPLCIGKLVHVVKVLAGHVRRALHHPISLRVSSFLILYVLLVMTVTLTTIGDHIQHSVEEYLWSKTETSAGAEALIV